MFDVYTGQNVPIKAWTRGVPFEDMAREQTENLASLPFIHKHIAVMPDVHGGYGATVGSVIPTKGAVIPAAVGVDIGCGMMAVKTDLEASDLPDSLKALRSEVEAAIPVGFNQHSEDQDVAWNTLALSGIISDHPRLGGRGKLMSKARLQTGTLGGGNHFIELCLDENDDVWIMLHSGSRGIGNIIGRYFMDVAKEEMRTHFINLPDKDLAYLPEGTQNFDDYIYAVDWAQDYARQNREAMMRLAINALAKHTRDFEVGPMAVNCHHNYVQRENHFGSNVLLTRKGAVSAKKDELGIIPGSMGARSYIVRGKGNAESFHSCSHGAGRVMSRTKARNTFTVEDHKAATRGVECRKDEGVIDETPAAYKDIDAVMAAQSDLVDIVHTLKQVMCIKG